MQALKAKNVHVTALSEFLRIKYGAAIASRLMAHILIFKKTLKHYEFRLMDMDAFCFQLYFVFKYIVEIYLPQKATVDVSKVQVIHVMILASHFVYSYSGPETQYYIKMFISGQLRYKFNWTHIHLDLLRTDLSTRMLNLYRNIEYWQEEYRKFLSLNEQRTGAATSTNTPTTTTTPIHSKKLKSKKKACKNNK